MQWWKWKNSDTIAGQPGNGTSFSQGMDILLTGLRNGMNFLGNIWAVTCISESQLSAESHV